MPEDINQLKTEAKKDSSIISDCRGLEEFRIKYLGKKGAVARMYSLLGAVAKEDKPAYGKSINDFKLFVSKILEDKTKEVTEKDKNDGGDCFDVTLPGISFDLGQRHILTQVIDDICLIFERLGFSVQDGPEIETEYNNFTALNIPANHPSRDGFDTFYLEEKERGEEVNLLLRSHTSPGQIRILKENTPPLAVVIPGRVYRPDAVDASHSFMFHQIEGLLVDADVKFSDLKGLLTSFLKKMFGDNIKMRFRPHFFPFTEPSAEVDISCYICSGKGCSVCGQNGWLEIMGCGMVHPHVFQAAGYKNGKYTGLAFGLGVERIAMLRYGINDIRIFYENDKRFLSQF